MKKHAFLENARLLGDAFGITPLMYGSLGQYLKVYTASAKDGYRVNVRNKKDLDKIAFIREQLHWKES